jgi:hypothetical protein
MELAYRKELAIIAFAAVWLLLFVALRYGWL